LARVKPIVILPICNASQKMQYPILFAEVAAYDDHAVAQMLDDWMRPSALCTAYWANNNSLKIYQARAEKIPAHWIHNRGRRNGGWSKRRNDIIHGENGMDHKTADNLIRAWVSAFRKFLEKSIYIVRPNRSEKNTRLRISTWKMNSFLQGSSRIALVFPLRIRARAWYIQSYSRPEARTSTSVPRRDA